MVKKKKNRIKERTKGFRNENIGIDSWESTPMYRSSELSEILGLQSSDQCMTSDEDDFEDCDSVPKDMKCECGGCIWEIKDADGNYMYSVCGDCLRRYK